MTDTFTINVPKHLQDAVGAAQSAVIPIHMADRNHSMKGGLVRVYEPRRDCEYWVKQSEIYPVPQKRW